MALPAGIGRVVVHVAARQKMLNAAQTLNPSICMHCEFVDEGLLSLLLPATCQPIKEQTATGRRNTPSCR
jgi:hypothetical protein